MTDVTKTDELDPSKKLDPNPTPSVQTPKDTSIPEDSHKKDEKDKEIGISDVVPAPEESKEPKLDIKQLDALVADALENKLTDAQKKIINDAGFEKHFQTLVQSELNKVQAITNEIYKSAGSKEELITMQNWASSVFSKEEKAAYNKATKESGDLSLAKMAIENLKNRYLQANPKAPTRKIDGGNVVGGTDKFKSVDEFIRASTTHKYATDEAHRKEIDAKRKRSGF